MLKRYTKLTVEGVIGAIIVLIILVFYCEKLHAKQLIKHQKQTRGIEQEVLLTPIEKQWLKKHDPIKVAVKSGWMPIEFQLENQLHRGYTIDYLEKIANLLQIDFEIIPFSEDFNVTTPDIISSVSGDNVNHANFKVLSQPYLVLPNAVYMTSEQASKINFDELESLQQSKIAVYKKGSLITALRKNYPKLKIITVDIADEAFDYLRFGSVDAYIGNEFVIDYHIEVHRLGFVEKVGLTPFTSEVSMAVRKNAPELIGILEKATTTIGQNNPSLLNHWVKKKSYAESFLIAALVLILLIVIILTFRYFRLKNKSKIEQAAILEKIWHQANFDYLTNLPNRYHFKNKLEESIEQAKIKNTQICLIFIDLDQFKEINDTSGHSVGDKLLQHCAVRISNCVSENAIIARLGGDEFMVLLPQFDSKSHIDATCECMLKSIQSPFEIGSETFFISASIGVTFFPDDSEFPEELVRYADQAMYESKNLGRNQYQYFNQSMQMAVSKRTEMINDIRSGIKKNQFELYYQPIINISNRSIIKAEALIRWNHPLLGLISPIEFIPLAEVSGLINELGDWVFNQAINNLVTINSEINGSFSLSINVSPFQFSKPEILINWINVMQQKEINGENICLEITEGLLLEPSETVTEVIHSLSKHGVQFAIDDFGTGYSALGYLQNFKIDFIKIDKSFTQNLDSSHFNSTLCNFIIQMAHQLDIKLIAEGVEVTTQEDILNTLKCDYAQGYFYGKPMPLNQLINHLKELNT